MAMRTLRTFSVILLLAVVILGLSSGDVSANAEQQEKIDLRILYAGHPGSAREKDFVSFLGDHFRIVQASDLAEFKPLDAKEFDVVIFDYDGDGFEAPKPSLPRSYRRATVTVGVVGAFVCGQVGLKTGYL